MFANTPASAREPPHPDVRCGMHEKPIAYLRGEYRGTLPRSRREESGA
jgi:hypothetical protein